MTDADAAPLWAPDPAAVEGLRIAEFARIAAERTGRPMAAPGALHDWSIADPDDFWSTVWDSFGVIGERGPIAAVPTALPRAEFFPGARLNLAENLLRPRPGVDPGEDLAVIATGEAGAGIAILERATRAELVERVAAVAEGLRERGVRPGECIGVILPVGVDALVVCLAALSIGAVVANASPDFGADAVIDRFGQLEPVLIAATASAAWKGTRHDRTDTIVDIVRGIPGVRSLVLVPGADDVSSPVDPDSTDARRIAALSIAGSSRLLRVDMLAAVEAAHAGAAPAYERLPFDHPAYVLFTSGTTGKPKCLVHRAGGVLLKHLVEIGLHCDIGPGDRLLFATTTGWMLWNWQLSALALGATLVLHGGASTHPGPDALFDVAAITGATHLGLGAGILDALRAAGLPPSAGRDLSSLRMLLVTASPYSARTAAWVADDLGPEVMPQVMSGGTDLIGGFLGADPRFPVWAGEMQGATLGMDVDVVDADGTPLPPGVEGELVCRNPFPTVPVGIWGDDGTRLHEAYFAAIPGMWTHGDLTSRTERGGFVIHGRSDATLNIGGVRIGTGEIYSALEGVPEVVEALAFAQEREAGTRLVLLVVMAPGVVLDDALRERIGGEIRRRRSARHVPGLVVAVPELPRTRTGKVAEIAVAQAVHARPVPGRDALADPAVLDTIAALPDLSGD